MDVCIPYGDFKTVGAPVSTEMHPLTGIAQHEVLNSRRLTNTK